MPTYQNKFPAKSLASGEAEFLFGLLNTAVAIAATPSGLVRSNGTVVCTTGAAHSFVIGQRVRIQGSTSTLFGANSDQAAIYGFDGEYTILTVPSTTTFTYLDLNKPNDTGGGGNAISVQAEAVTGGQRSSQIALQDDIAAPAHGVIVGLYFTAAPTSGSIQIQEALDDVEGGYLTPVAAAYTIALGAATYYEADLIPFGSRFMRLLVGTVPGAGSLLARALRVQ